MTTPLLPSQKHKEWRALRQHFCDYGTHLLHTAQELRQVWDQRSVCLYKILGVFCVLSLVLLISHRPPALLRLLSPFSLLSLLSFDVLAFQTLQQWMGAAVWFLLSFLVLLFSLMPLLDLLIDKRQPTLQSYVSYLCDRRSLKLFQWFCLIIALYSVPHLVKDQCVKRSCGQIKLKLPEEKPQVPEKHKSSKGAADAHGLSPTYVTSQDAFHDGSLDRLETNASFCAHLMHYKGDALKAVRAWRFMQKALYGLLTSVLMLVSVYVGLGLLPAAAGIAKRARQPFKGCFGYARGKKLLFLLFGMAYALSPESLLSTFFMLVFASAGLLFLAILLKNSWVGPVPKTTKASKVLSKKPQE